MKTAKVSTLVLAALAVSLASFPLSAETTDPVGAVVVDLTEGADTIVSIPFTDNPAFVGVVDTVTDLGSDLYQIGLNGTVQAGDANGFANLYYVRFSSGSANGKYFTVSASTTTSVTIDSIGDDLSGLAQSDGLSVYSYHTLASIFPPATQDSLVVSGGNLGFQRGSEILLPERSGTGINRAPTLKYFVTSTEWRDTVNFANSDNVILFPDTYMVIRQKSGAGSKSFVMHGSVPMNNHNINLQASTVSTDNYVSVGRPVDTRLDELGLGTEFVDSGGNLGFQRADELLVWENPSGINPAPDKKFFRVAGEWRVTTDFSASNDYIVPAGAAIIIRKKAQGTEETLFWNNSPNY